ncbi:hypothetical protein ACVPOW_08210 [Staphylococcus aureus]
MSQVVLEKSASNLLYNDDHLVLKRVGITGGSNMSDKYYRFAYMNVILNAVASNFKVFSTLHPNKTSDGCR